ncbi:hypothetical protein BDM02DRAFT_2889392 [Thelephora ganbajun]|uniref:Uncharacterized protein n=1 Tax=Thelephora ganbajun TaxID=370292 RepID=A0ACB6ZAV2_THEGA|nr:hypothetical protein BDM02DRAFT_2889392 [Thelephora ganbajun]
MVVCRLIKIGIRFTSEKQQALLRGDTSGAVIHPFFISAAQSLGMHFCEGMGNLPAMIRLQAKYLQTCLELLADIFKGHDWELRAQAVLWAVVGSVISWQSHLTTLYVKKSCEAVNTAKLQFVPTYGRPPAFSEDLHEKFCVLSQVIYFENFSFLACGGAEPSMTARIEKEFRHRLHEVYPILFRICPLAMRTQSILLVRDTVVVLSLRPTEEVQLEFWRRSCDHLVTDLDNYSQSLLFNLRRFQELGDKSGSGSIRRSCVGCLAHLAVLCETLCQMGPTKAELDNLCISALERLTELTEGMHTEEYTRLDLLLGLSWKKALGVFDARITNDTLERGTNFRHWRKTVAEVYSDFVAKLPGAESPILSSRARQLDGRTEGSRYPNMMLPWVRQRYGLGL